MRWSEYECENEMDSGKDNREGKDRMKIEECEKKQKQNNRKLNERIFET